ncbi:MAG: class I mannose-6-phosphate isomerase [Leptospiraceae bacterium]|nr:class I mannose-6-phosphate isomerase [Leptospiraceae bacterium]MDW8307149.1 class I mannose-6-phosphate isomerase [Leptospiraceae bacterium]
MSLGKLQPVVVPKPWGGGHLDHFALDPHTRVGELVVYSQLPQYPVIIEEEGKTYKAKEYKIQFPFMVKLLSAQEPLSLQNHPADEDIPLLGLEGCGKTECWFILAAESSAKIYLGLKEGYDQRIFEKLEELNNPLSYFNSFSPRPGDIFFLPAGMVHGTQGRILFYEIQQNCDYTFRIFDFGRKRSLNLKEAAQVYRPHVPLFLHDQKYFACRYFRFWPVKLEPEKTFSQRREFPQLITWTGEHAILSVEDKDINLNFGDTVIMDANVAFAFRAESPGWLICAASA